MVTQNSRRFFLFGRRAPPSAWGNFCARLARTCQGSVRWSDDSADPQAWLVPAREGDIAHAQALCREYGVTLMLKGLAVPDRSAFRSPLLWLEPGAAWSTCSLEQEGETRLRADAACTLAQVQAQGVTGLNQAPADWTVAQWLASPFSAAWSTGRGDLSAIDRVQVRLFDATVEVLGPFGANARTPLRSMTVQLMVPKLFELTGTDQARACLAEPVWPASLRLDALMPAAGQEVNLAHLLAGHGGALAWVQTVWFKVGVADPEMPVTRAADWAAESAGSSASALRLTQQLKEIFDPIGLFPPNQ